jgi:hypothetical protein
MPIVFAMLVGRMPCAFYHIPHAANAASAAAGFALSRYTVGRFTSVAFAIERC